MIRLILTVSSFIYAVLQRYAPTNIVLGRIRQRRGLKWGIPAMLLAAPYIVLAHWCSSAIGDGAPGWFNLVVLLCVWNALKFIAIGPISVALLIRARYRERIEGREAATESKSLPIGSRSLVRGS